MSRLKAFFTMETSWYLEVWLIVYPLGQVLTKVEKIFLSQFKNKSDAQQALENRGTNLYNGEIIRLKDAVRILMKEKL